MTDSKYEDVDLPFNSIASKVAVSDDNPVQWQAILTHGVGCVTADIVCDKFGFMSETQTHEWVQGENSNWWGILTSAFEKKYGKHIYWDNENIDGSNVYGWIGPGEPGPSDLAAESTHENNPNWEKVFNYTKEENEDGKKICKADLGKTVSVCGAIFSGISCLLLMKQVKELTQETGECCREVEEIQGNMKNYRFDGKLKGWLKDVDRYRTTLAGYAAEVRHMAPTTATTKHFEEWSEKLDTFKRQKLEPLEMEVRETKKAVVERMQAIDKIMFQLRVVKAKCIDGKTSSVNSSVTSVTTMAQGTKWLYNMPSNMANVPNVNLTLATGAGLVLTGAVCLVANAFNYKKFNDTLEQVDISEEQALEYQKKLKQLYDDLEGIESLIGRLKERIVQDREEFKNTNQLQFWLTDRKGNKTKIEMMKDDEVLELEQKITEIVKMEDPLVTIFVGGKVINEKKRDLRKKVGIFKSGTEFIYEIETDGDEDGDGEGQG